MTPTITTNTGTALVLPADYQSRATILSFRSEDRGLANIFRAQLGGETVTGGTYGSAANDVARIDKKLDDLEFAYAVGAFKFQTEYTTFSYDASAPSSAANLSPYNQIKLYGNTTYGEFIYNITNEQWSDAYKGGAFTGVKPNSNYRFGNGGTGAWQAAVRYSTYTVRVPLNTNGVASANKIENTKSATDFNSSGQTITWGLNWLLNPNTAVKFNYAVTKFNQPVKLLSVTPDSAKNATTTFENTVSVRAQINF